MLRLSALSKINMPVGLDGGKQCCSCQAAVWRCTHAAGILSVAVSWWTMGRAVLALVFSQSQAEQPCTGVSLLAHPAGQVAAAHDSSLAG